MTDRPSTDKPKDGQTGWESGSNISFYFYRTPNFIFYLISFGRYTEERVGHVLSGTLNFQFVVKKTFVVSASYTLLEAKLPYDPVCP